MGVTEYLPSDAGHQQMTHHADVALYASKAGGRNRVTPNTPGLEGKP